MCAFFLMRVFVCVSCVFIIMCVRFVCEMLCVVAWFIVVVMCAVVVCAC